jgi:hypothetical protein
MLNKLILSHVPHPEALNIDRMNFAAKVSWAHALAAIRSEDVPWYRALNKIRNRLAHELGGEPTDEDIEALLLPLKGETLAMAEEALKADDPQLREVLGPDRSSARARLRLSLMVHLLALEQRNLLRLWERDYEEGLQRIRVQRALTAMATHLGDDDKEELAAKEKRWRVMWGVPDPPTVWDALGLPDPDSPEKSGSPRPQ